MKRMILLTTVGAVMAAMMAANALSSVSAQDAEQSATCAPWSKEWDVSKGWWYFDWYRWCYDPSTSDPAIEDNWYREWGDWEWGNQVNLCPESGICRMSSS